MCLLRSAILLACICAFRSCVTSTKPFHVHPIRNASGIYFNRIGSAQFFSLHWELVSYFDLNVFKHKFEFVNERFDGVKNVCRSVPTSMVCPLAMKQITKILVNLNRAHVELTEAVAHRRYRRSIFTGGRPMPEGWLTDGRVLGTTYSSDYYDEAIDGLVPEAPRMNVIRANYSHLDQRIEELEEAKSVINTRLDIITEKSNNNKLMLSEVLKYMDEMAQFAELTRKQFGLLAKIMLFEKSDVLAEDLFTKEQFIDELKNIDPSLISGTRFAYALDLDHVDDLIRTSKFIKFYSKTKIVFVFQVPLGGSRLELYNVLPLPSFNVRDPTSFGFVNPSFPFYAINHDKTEYALMRNLKACHSLDANSLICKNHLVYRLDQAPICEGSLLRDEPTIWPRTCLPHFRKGHVLATHFLSDNHWIIATSNAIEIHVNCSDKRYIAFSKFTSMFTMRSDCEASINGSLLLPTKSPHNLATNTNSDIVPSSNIWISKSMAAAQPIANVTDLFMLSDNVMSVMGVRFRLATFGIDSVATDSMETYYRFMLRILGMVLGAGFVYLTWQLCATLNVKRFRKSLS